MYLLRKRQDAANVISIAAKILTHHPCDLAIPCVDTGTQLIPLGIGITPSQFFGRFLGMVPIPVLAVAAVGTLMRKKERKNNGYQTNEQDGGGYPVIPAPLTRTPVHDFPLA